MINFGQPRIGDDSYAQFSNTMLPNQWRHVHHKDVVPHTPQESFPLNFHHSRYEVYEDEEGYRVCDASGEDKLCSDKWHSWNYNSSDHLLYMF